MTADDVRDRMKQGGWTGRGLASALGVSYPTISRWRNGRNAAPGGWLDAIEGAEMSTHPSARGRFKSDYFVRPVAAQRQRTLSQRMLVRRYRHKARVERRAAHA